MNENTIAAGMWTTMASNRPPRATWKCCASQITTGAISAHRYHQVKLRITSVERGDVHWPKKRVNCQASVVESSPSTVATAKICSMPTPYFGRARAGRSVRVPRMSNDWSGGGLISKLRPADLGRHVSD